MTSNKSLHSILKVNNLNKNICKFQYIKIYVSQGYSCFPRQIFAKKPFRAVVLNVTVKFPLRPANYFKWSVTLLFWVY